MAGRGPAPKPQAERRNRTAPSRGDWVDLHPLSGPLLPTLPKRAKGTGSWSSRTRALYDGWRKDPVTQTYGEPEIAAVVELAHLQEEVSRGRVSLATEVRQRADGLALTLKGKRDLRFNVLTEPQEEAPKPAVKSSGGDRRARLSLVA